MATAAPLALPLLVPSVTNIGLAEEWSSLPPLRLKKETAFVGFLVTLSQNKGRSATVSSRTSGMGHGVHWALLSSFQFPPLSVIFSTCVRCASQIPISLPLPCRQCRTPQTESGPRPAPR